jgi:membrane fusion protein, macrolide-specific efflux system
MIGLKRGCHALALAFSLALIACGKAPTSAGVASASASKAVAQDFVAVARGKVDVEGGLVRVAATRDGVVTKLLGDIGSRVKVGDVLIALDTKQVQIAVDLTRAELAAANAQATLLRAKLPGLKLRTARVREATIAGAASGQSADDAQQALAELNAEITVAEANVDAAKQKIKQAEYEVDARTLRAPVAGRIVARTTHIGDAVLTQSATDLVELLPDARHIVRAELNEGFVSQIVVGMNAQVYSEADSSKIFAARVTRIGDVFGPSRLVEETQEANDARDIECILDLPNSDLRIGQRVQVRFLRNAVK